MRIGIRTKLYSPLLLILQLNIAFFAHAVANFEEMIENQPVQARLDESLDESLDTSLDNPIVRQAIQNYQVKIFPHQGRYVSPQGAEANIKFINITAEGSGCRKFKAVMKDFQWQPDGPELESGTSFDFSQKSVRYYYLKLYAEKFKSTVLGARGVLDAFYFECTNGFSVNRFATPTREKRNYQYDGHFVVIFNLENVTIVNIVDAETYLKGVVPSEVPTSWDTEALRAQAVAARTYARHDVEQSRTKARRKTPTKLDEVFLYDLVDTVQDQAYGGVTAANDRTSLAVDDTRGKVALHNHALIRAFFSASAGGLTESSQDEFDMVRPYCIVKEETFEQAKVPLEANQWSRSFSLSSLFNRLVAAAVILPADRHSSISNVWILNADLTKGQRVKRISIQLQNGRVYFVDSDFYRPKLGFRSSFFTVSIQTGKNKKTKKLEQQVVFSGKGFGHGVGMSQWGAQIYASTLNWSHEQILKFYYSGIRFSTLD